MPQLFTMEGFRQPWAASFVNGLALLPQKNAVIESLQEQVSNAKEKLVKLMSAECTYDSPEWAVPDAASARGLALPGPSECPAVSENESGAAARDSLHVPAACQHVQGPGASRRDTSPSPAQQDNMPFSFLHKQKYLPKSWINSVSIKNPITFWIVTFYHNFRKCMLHFPERFINFCLCRRRNSHRCIHYTHYNVFRSFYLYTNWNTPCLQAQILLRQPQMFP